MNLNKSDSIALWLTWMVVYLLTHNDSYSAQWKVFRLHTLLAPRLYDFKVWSHKNLGARTNTTSFHGWNYKMRVTAHVHVHVHVGMWSIHIKHTEHNIGWNYHVHRSLNSHLNCTGYDCHHLLLQPRPQLVYCIWPHRSHHYNLLWRAVPPSVGCHDSFNFSWVPLQEYTDIIKYLYQGSQ